MTRRKSDPLVSMSGSPIYYHGPEKAWEPANGEECLEQISAHVEKHLGKIQTVLHELVSDAVHVDVHVVSPTLEFPFARLVTSGMSDLPMTLLQRAGVDLSEPDTVRAVAVELDTLVARLEQELGS